MTEEIRNYTELSKLKTFEDRFKYLYLGDRVGNETFGFDRYLNQIFYRNSEWRRIREEVIVRDLGCDLGCSFDVINYEIRGPIIVHHMNPISANDIKNRTDFLLSPEYLVCVSLDTHNGIHFGGLDYLNVRMFVERYKGDTTLW